MKKTTVIIAILLFVSTHTNAQKQTQAAHDKSLQQVLILKIDRPGGANGANVAWHPGQKKYYAAMAGNVSFPMEVFDAKGKMVSPDSLETMFDVRGLWYNPTSKTLQANGFDDFGWGEYKLDAKGMPVSLRKLSIVTSQPDPQSIGAYDAKKNVLYLYDYTTAGIERHKMKDGVSDTTIRMHLGAKTKADISEFAEGDAKDNYNQNAIIYTGNPRAEIGFLNVVDRQIELYNIADGLMTQVLKLPDDAPAESSLNFSYSNGIYWLFNKTDREWHGYKYQ